MALTHILSLREVAELLDVTGGRVQQLVRDRVIPKTGRGRYELVPVVHGYLKFWRDRAAGDGAVGYEFKARLVRARALIAEMDLMKARGEVVSLAMVERVAGDEYAVLRSRLLGLPDKMAALCETTPGVDGKRELLRRCVVEALEELSADHPEAEATDA